MTGNLRQALITLSVVLEPRFADGDAMDLALPLPDERKRVVWAVLMSGCRSYVST